MLNSLGQLGSKVALPTTCLFKGGHFPCKDGEWNVYQQAWGADPETEIYLAGSGVPEGLGWNWQYMESSQVGEGRQRFT